MSDDIPRESKEYISLGFKVDGTIPLSGVEAVMLPSNTRPLTGDWAAAELVDGEWRILVGPGLTIGAYDIWARHADNPEVTVRRARRAINIV